jgi:hypothetical protein
LKVPAETLFDLLPKLNRAALSQPCCISRNP